MELGLKGKVVVVTGGSSGIGKAVAEAFAREGCFLCVCGRSREKLDEMKAEFERQGWPLLTVEADVTKTADLKVLAEAAFQKWKAVDVWVNNAGINIRKPFDSLSEEEWYRLVDTNLKSVYFGAAVAADYMKRDGKGGVILNTSSFTSIMPTAGTALYNAVKAAVDSLTRTMATELACHKIRVNSVIPGYIETPLTAENVAKNKEFLLSSIPVRRLGKPEDLASAYVFLASDKAAYINGVSLPVAGGKFSTQNPQWSWQQS